jgi:hypothetical protein
MIKTIKANRINIDKRGKITTGIKKKSESTGKEYPATTDYFVIDDFPELKPIYGEKPKKLVVVFPTNIMIDFFTVDYVLYGSNNTMIRKCDGEECMHRIDEELLLVSTLDDEGNAQESEHRNKKYIAGELSECCCKLMAQTIDKNGKEAKNPKHCSCAMYLKAFLVDYKTKKIISPLCYHFYSGSENTAANIYSELTKIQTMMNGRIAGLPFGLSVDMVPGKTNAKIKYPIWTLQILGTMAQLEQAAESFLFDYREILQIGKDTPNQLPQGDNETLNKNLTDEIQEKLNPDYWVNEIKKLKSASAIDKFEKSYSLELSQFGGEDEVKILQAFEHQRNLYQ